MDLWPNKSYENVNYIRFVYLGPEYVGVELGILKIGQLENELYINIKNLEFFLAAIFDCDFRRETLKISLVSWHFWIQHTRKYKVPKSVAFIKKCTPGPISVTCRLQ